ncbi:hypothetical protein [uncultured Rikenella sp.]|uniref:hypothetical protein n=1 Tax=uncultured Rikenella sp. TaxID=368003 RepID=UPI0025EB92CD|nr:hypothetical protein [uncultured Rikenella sp.]
MGALNLAGGHGASWASTANGTNGFYLYFHPTILNPGRMIYRAYGFQLRCLSE